MQQQQPFGAPQPFGAQPPMQQQQFDNSNQGMNSMPPSGNGFAPPPGPAAMANGSMPPPTGATAPQGASDPFGGANSDPFGGATSDPFGNNSAAAPIIQQDPMASHGMHGNGFAPPPPPGPNNMNNNMNGNVAYDPNTALSGGPYQPQQPFNNGGINPPPLTGGVQQPGPHFNPQAAPFDVEAELQKCAQFNSTSLFVRPTVARLPKSQQTKQRLNVPVGVVFRPLAPVPEGHPPVAAVAPIQGVPVSSSKQVSGVILRCKKCLTYINPYVTWHFEGRQWRCNVCQQQNDCPDSYYSCMGLDGDETKRADLWQRPELSHGCVDFIATEAFMERPPQPPVFMFMFDVSAGAVESGYLQESVTSVKEALQSGAIPGGDRAQVGVMTFDQSLHYYNLDPALSNPGMIVVGSLDDLFVPLPDNILVNLQDNVDQVCGLLDQLPNLFRDNKVRETCMGSCLKGAALAMKHVGGKIMCFSSGAPSVGEGSLKPNRDKPLNQMKEVESLSPARESFTELTQRLWRFHITVDMFIAPKQGTFFDLATMKLLSQYTAGDVKFYENFTPQSQGLKLRSEVKHHLTRMQVWEAMMRVRVSKGWKISHFMGHMFRRKTDLLHVPNCHEDFTFAIGLEMEEGYQNVDNTCCIQSALVYTNSEGERRIRVHTYTLVASDSHTECCSSIDPQATALLMNHMSVNKSLGIVANANLQSSRSGSKGPRPIPQHTTDPNARTGLAEGRQYLTNTLTNIIQGANSNPNIDRTCLEYLVMYVMGCLKSEAMRQGTSSDRRISAWSRLATLNCDEVALYFCPSMYSLHDLQEGVGSPDEQGNMVLPQKLSASVECMSAQGAFLMDNGEEMILWLGSEVNPQWMQSVFNVEHPSQLILDGSMSPEQLMEPTGDATQQQVLNAIEAIRNQHKPSYQALTITVQQSCDAAERKFFEYLIEDKTQSLQATYNEFCNKVGLRR